MNSDPDPEHKEDELWDLVWRYIPRDTDPRYTMHFALAHERSLRRAVRGVIRCVPDDPHRYQLAFFNEAGEATLEIKLPRRGRLEEDGLAMARGWEEWLAAQGSPGRLVYEGPDPCPG